MLLRELAETAFREGEEETTTDGRLVLTRLEQALDRARPHSVAAPAEWPAHGLGPVGARASARGHA